MAYGYVGETGQGEANSMCQILEGKVCLVWQETEKKKGEARTGKDDQGVMSCKRNYGDS